MKKTLNNKKAYLSGLGSMGRKHLKGLIRIGCIVESYDPNETTFAIAERELKKEGLNSKNLVKVENPKGKYDFAIFSETAPYRFKNFSSFINISNAKKILLEKPISSNSEEINAFLRIAKEKKIEKKIEVNFLRRSWLHINEIFKHCKNEEEFTMTLNGGAIGLGCNGIHFIDTFILFSNNEMPSVKWVELSKELIESGRGKEFYDFGGNFVITTSKGNLLSSLTANSSANVILTVKGKNFIITVDYGNLTWTVMKKQTNSNLPIYRYGAEYGMVENGTFQIPTIDSFIEDWTSDTIKLPDLKIAMLSHKCVEDILIFGGAKPPFRYT